MGLLKIFPMWQGPVGRRATRSAGGPPAQPAGAGNLEEVTHEPHALSDVLDGSGGVGQLCCKLTEYPDGWRVVAFRKAGPRVQQVDVAREVPSAEVSPVVLARSSESLLRTKRLVLHRARCLEVQSLWTFTKRGKFSDVDAVWEAWRAFTQMMRRRWGKEFRFVAVPELHSDGETWHLHVLFGRFFMVEQLRSYWYRALGGSGKETGSATPGSVNVKSLRARHSVGRRVAAYVSKYVGKGFESCSNGRRLFSSSVGLDPVRVVRWYCPYDDGLVDFFDSVGRRCSFDFGLERLYPRFHISRTYVAAVADTG